MIYNYSRSISRVSHIYFFSVHDYFSTRDPSFGTTNKQCCLGHFSEQESRHSPYFWQPHTLPGAGGSIVPSGTTRLSSITLSHSSELSLFPSSFVRGKKPKTSVVLW